MKNKLQVGDFVLVTGPSHYEKATVIKVDKKTGVVTLDNQMQITQGFDNISRTQMKAEPFDQEKLDFLHANSLFEANIRTFLRYKDELPREAIVTINSRLEKWLQKYNIKRI